MELSIKMKRKCDYCGIIFFFKIKQLRISENQYGYYKKPYKKYIINCTFCYTPKEVFLNHTPNHLKSKYLISNPRKSRIEMIKSTKESIENNNDILDIITSKRIISQLVSNNTSKNNIYYYLILWIEIILIIVLLLIL